MNVKGRRKIIETRFLWARQAPRQKERWIDGFLDKWIVGKSDAAIGRDLHRKAPVVDMVFALLFILMSIWPQDRSLFNHYI
jgi:hypothetical protein